MERGLNTHNQIKGFNGDHRWGMNNIDVERVCFESSRFVVFPSNLQGFFPNLKSLSLICGPLKQISRPDLDAFYNLVDLSLFDCHIELLPDDLFVNTPNLKRVDLCYNKIKFASSKLIEPIANQLEEFDLTWNTSINAIYLCRKELRETRFRWGASVSHTIKQFKAIIDTKCSAPPDNLGALPPPSAASAVLAPSVHPPAAANTSPGASHIAAYSSQLALTSLVSASSKATVHSKYVDVFNELRKSSRLTDFVIVVGPKEFRVHKTFLAFQSSVFELMSFVAESSTRI